MQFTSLPVRSEQLFRYLFEESSLGIAVEDLDGTLLLANPALCSILGYHNEELCGMNCSQFADPEDSGADWALFQKLRAGLIDRYSLEKRYVRKDGARIWGRLNVSLLKSSDGGTPLVFAFVEEATEQHRAEEKLREYEKAVEGSEEMIAVVDREYRYLIANRKFLSYRSMTKEQVVGRLVPEVLNKGVFETVVKEKLDECFRGKVVRYEMTYTYPELGERHLFISNFPIESSAGVDRVACILQDITERKQAENALRESEGRLRVAAEVGRMYAWEWDPATDSVLRSAECADIMGLSDAAREGIAKDYFSFIHPDDRAALWSLVDSLTAEEPVYRTQYRKFRPDGVLLWLEESGRATFDEVGKMVRLVGMTADITARKQAEEALRESEDRLRLAVQAGRMYAYEWNVVADVLVRSPEYVKILGLTVPVRSTRQQFLEKIHPDDREDVIAAIAGLTAESPTRDVTYRVLLPGGAVIWLTNSGRAFFDGEGKMLRVIGMVADVTDHKLAEEALSGLSRRLIQAQEQERARIARDLHDDVTQRLALLAIELQQLQLDPPDSVSEVCTRIGELRRQIVEVSTAVQTLSHELHSSKLEYLGIVAAMGGFCREFGEQQKINIEFESHDVPTPLPEEISVCLFRVLQEALHNAAKHSGARQLEVRLWHASDEIHLTVRDFGVGFEPKAAMKGQGLGLTSMKERLHLVNGEISIDSGPKRGTTIHARVPLSSANDSRLAVG